MMQSIEGIMLQFRIGDEFQNKALLILVKVYARHIVYIQVLLFNFI